MNGFRSHFDSRFTPSPSNIGPFTENKESVQYNTIQYLFEVT